MNRYNRSRRPSAYTSTAEQHLTAQVQVYPKGSTIPEHIQDGDSKGFVICKSKV